MKRTKITPELEQSIIRDYQEGLSSLKIKDKYGVNPTTVFNILKRNGLSGRSNSINSRKYFCNEDFFEVINTEEKAYWLGFVYADGWISKQQYADYFGVSLSTVDKEHLYKLKDHMDSTYKVHNYKHDTSFKDGTEYSVYKVCSRKLVSDLIDKGVLEQKTDIVEAPSFLDEKFIPSFLRGYFDGDGSFSYHKSKRNKNIYGLKILGTEAFLDFINDYIEKHAGFRIPRYSKRREHQTVKCYELNGKKRCEAFLDIIYKDANVYLDRKYEKYVLFKQGKLAQSS